MGRCRLVFSGAGGQGVITAAIILAETAVLYEGLNAVQSQSYGPEARGGATRSDVIISDSEIYFPKVTQPNVLVCLTQAAYEKFHPIIRPGGLLITDIHLVRTSPRIDAIVKAFPLHERTVKKFGNSIAINICLLGTIIELTKLVRPESIQKVLERHVPPQFLAMNLEALSLGMEMVRA